MMIALYTLEDIMPLPSENEQALLDLLNSMTDKEFSQMQHYFFDRLTAKLSTLPDSPRRRPLLNNKRNSMETMLTFLAVFE
jgi:hypothetical protein